MADAMVTARMSVEKKEAANRVFEKLGTNASQAINGMFDYVIRYGELPYDRKEPRKYTPEEIAEAKAWVESLVIRYDDDEPNRFADMTRDEIRRERLISRGMATEEDFE